MTSEKAALVFPPLAQVNRPEVPRWSAPGLIGLWALAVVPMAVLSLGVAPVLIERYPAQDPGLLFWGTIIAGMVWLFIVSVAVLIWEGQVHSWDDLCRSIWLTTPREPVTGRASWRALWVVALVGMIFVLSSEVALDWVDDALASVLPAWMTPEYGDIARLAVPENAGNWTILWMALLSGLFNYVLGEALFFHGILLPRMETAFGRWAWLANAVAFGCYHLHKAATLPTQIVTCMAYSLPSQYLRSIWPALVIHGVEGAFVIAAVLFVVLGGLT
ncbi:MAG: type II CAAX prenyl endopeptidase Rce1 family protein [Tabrizicola sp.]